MANDRLKESIELVEGMIDTFQKNMTETTRSDGKDVSEKDFREQFYEDLLDYLLYLSCADGFISNEESEFIEKYLGYYMTPSELKRRIIEKKLCKKEYREEPSDIFMYFAAVQQAYDEVRALADTDIMKCLFLVWRRAGTDFTNCDGQQTYNEVNLLIQYDNMLCRTLEEKLGRPMEPFQGTEKRKEGITGGVEAPEIQIY